MEIHIGDCISYDTFSGHVGAACIESIEITPPNEKYGYQVEQCSIKENDVGTVCLSDGHWCYFDQINQVLSSN